jgi:predicted permease
MAGMDDEVDNELDHHLRMRQRELMAGGMSEAEARQAALEKFGSLEAARHQCRALLDRRGRMRGMRLRLSEFRQDVTSAVRQMVAAPAFTLVAVTTLAVGIGGTTAIFSAVNSVVLRPLPVPEPDGIVLISETWRDSNGANMSVGNFVDMAAEQTVFEAVGAATFENMTMSRDTGAERVVVGKVSAGFFDVFRTGAARGRVFTAEEDRPGRELLVVLSHRYWFGPLGADPDIIGKTLTLNTRPHAVIGVMPADFDFTSDSESMWVPVAFTPEQRAQHDEHYLSVFGRLRPGVTLDHASQEMRAIGGRLAQRFPTENADRSLAVGSLIDYFVSNYRERLFVLLGAVSLVLLIACGNVSTLLLARGASRARELAVRSALGAGRARLLRQLLTESLVLGLISVAAGTLLAGVLLQLLVSTAPEGVPRLELARIDGTALGFAIALGLAASVVFGLVPAWRAARVDVVRCLREAVRGAGGRGVKDVVRSSLIGVEVALAVVLLVGAGLLIRSSIEMRRLEPGFNPAGVYSTRMTLPASKTSAVTLNLAASQIEGAVAAIPGVRSAAVSTAVPGFGSFFNGVLPEGETRETGKARDSRSRFVSPGFFRTMEIPIRKGRPFLESDRAGTELVAIVNEHLAARLFPGQDPIGRRLLCCNAHLKAIVGVAANVRAGGPARPVESELYLPLAQIDDEAWSWTRRNLFVVARTDGDAAALAPTVRRAVVNADPDIPLFSTMTMEERMARTIQTERFNTLLLVVLGLVGALLAAVGIYGVVSYFAAQRTPELGIRIALGASRGSVLGLVVRQAAVPVAIGIIAGGVAAAFATDVLESQLVNVQPTDPLTFAAGVAGIALVALLAAFFPARRAARVDPARTLLG